LEQVGTPPPLARALAAELPEIERATGFANMRVQPVKYEDRAFNESPVLTASNACFEIFTFPLIRGDKDRVLKEPNTVVLTQSMAEKYFGANNPLNKMITIGEDDYRIDGVMEDVPENAHFHFACLVSNVTFDWYNEEKWGWNFMYTYVLLRDPSDLGGLQLKLPDFITKYVHEGKSEHDTRYLTQPVTSIHLHSDLKFELGENGDFQNVVIFGTAAIFLIVIACINFMNLASARATARLKEIGIRKVMGSTRRQLIHQFLGESLLMSFISVLVGLVLVSAVMPVFHRLVGRGFGLGDVDLWMAGGALVCYAVVVGMASGIFPAFQISAFRPAQVMARSSTGGRAPSRFRNGMVVFQFAAAIVLMIGTLTIYRQLDFIQSKDLGFDRDQIMVVQNLKPDPLKSEALKQKLLQHPDIVAVSSTGNLPGMGTGNNYTVNEDGVEMDLNMFFCDFDYQKVLQFEMAEGRFFSTDFATDTAAAILNQRAVAKYGLVDPIGKRVGSEYGVMTVIGIVEDFHTHSLHQSIEPMVMFYGLDKDWGVNYVAVRVNTDDMASVVRFVQESWASINPDFIFDHSFLDESYSSLHTNEQTTGKVALAFCILAIAVCCLGLYGLSSFVVERRSKEIGIRRVLGASGQDTFWLLSRSFLLWASLAFVLAAPLALLIMKDWLENFAYRIDLSFWIFLTAGAVTFLVAFLPVGYQAFRAARANPVERLRCE
jgi:putative ABC transport system permease protein